MQNLTITRFLFKIYQFFDHTAVNLILRKHEKTCPQICFSVKSKIITLTWWAHISHLISRLHLLFFHNHLRNLHNLHTSLDYILHSYVHLSIHEFNKLWSCEDKKDASVQQIGRNNKCVKKWSNWDIKTKTCRLTWMSPMSSWHWTDCYFLRAWSWSAQQPRQGSHFYREQLNKHLYRAPCRSRALFFSPGHSSQDPLTLRGQCSGVPDISDTRHV